MLHILPCNALQRHRSCDTYQRISPPGSLVGEQSNAAYPPEQLMDAHAARHIPAHVVVSLTAQRELPRATP